jgi:hypothetical protein
VDHMNERVTFSENSQTDELVAIAARIAGTDGLGAVHIAVAERPTYDDLRYYHELARANGLLLTVSAHGLSLRPNVTKPVPAKQPAHGFASLWPEIGSVAARSWRIAHDRTLAGIAALLLLGSLS